MNTLLNTPTPASAAQRTHTSPQSATRLRKASLALLASAAALLGGAAQASTPVEKIICTQAPRNTWMSEQQARAAFKAESYVLVRFKISKGNCHEFYAIGHDGGVTEAYIHPVTGATVRSTHIPASLTAPASSPTGPAAPAAPAPVPAGRSSATPVIHSSFYFNGKQP